MKRIASLFSIGLLLLASMANAYTVPKTVSGFASGLATVGYTLYNSSTGAVAQARTTTGVHELGSTAIYAVAMAGTDGTEYSIVWDDGSSHYASDVLRDPALPTSAIKSKTDLIATNAQDSPNAVTAQTNAATAATQSASNATAIAALPTASQNAAAILVTPSNKLATNASGYVTLGAYATGQAPDVLVWGAATRALTDKAGFSLTSGEHTAIGGDVVAGLNTAAPGSITGGSAYAKLNAASSAGDPWSTPLPGAYAAGTAGYLLGHPLTLPSTCPLSANDETTLGYLFNMIAPNGGSPRYTAGALALAPTGSGGGSDPWATLLTAESTPGSFGAWIKTQLANPVPLPSEVANAVMGAAVYGGLTFKQLQAVEFALQMDADRTWNATTHTSVSTWYVRTGINTVDKTKPLVARTTVYDATNTNVVSQSMTITSANLP